MRKTKIVCTLGPSTDRPGILRQLLENGMDVARFNFSHGDYKEHKGRLDTLRALTAEMDLPVPAMLDTKGPEIRLGEFANGTENLTAGQHFTLTTRNVEGTSEICSVTYKDLPHDVEPGGRIMLDDGLIELKIDEVTDTDIHCTVQNDGVIKTKKGVNVPGVHLSMPYMSQRDRNDILFGIEQGFDLISASFTRNAKDIMEIRHLLDEHNCTMRIIAKIENQEGIDNIDEILTVADGIMVARGDMGVEIDFAEIPAIQKHLIDRAMRAGKICITATQMLDSMIVNPRPTRAEITDVANAVFDGTSAVMLSGETAAGKYPVEAVQVMAKIATQAEKDAFDMLANRKIRFDLELADKTNAVCDAACTMAMDVHAKAIIVVTKYGHTAHRMSKFRPFMPIVAATHVEKTYHQMGMNWGVFPVLAQPQKNSDDLMRHAIDCAKQIDMVTNGDLVVIAAGVPVDTPGSTNLLKVEVVGERR